MLICCTVCHREYVATRKNTDELFVCSRCQERTRLQNSVRLGLHPALERKWANNQQKSVADENYSGLTALDHAPSPMPSKTNKRANLSDPNSLPKIPGFEVSYQIGRGAMGSVYRARQIKSGRLVAIKVLACELSDRTDLVARFEREAYALKSLKNPNVVTVIDAGHVNDIHYFAMEFIDGITLRARINQAPIPLKEACFITSEILNGLKEAHKHGIIHRDLKPENVLLDYEGRDFSRLPSRVVLVDFGLVGIGRLAFDPHPNLTRSKVTMGTVNYMAPEQHVDAKRVDHRSDLYSLGVIFFEMLTNELPLGRYLLPFERDPNVPKEIDNILAKALSRAVEQRYFAAEAFLDDLQKINLEPAPQKEMQPVSRTSENFLYSIANTALRMRWTLLLLIAALLIGFGVKLSKYSEMPAAQHHKKNLSGQS